MNNQNKEIQAIIQMSDEQRRQQYENAKRNNAIRKAKKKKAEMRKKFVSTAFVASASFVIGMMAVNGYQQFMGSEKIANEFYSYTKEYGIDNDSNGYHAYYGGREISLDSAMEDIVNDAKYAGMSDVEISIGMSKVYNSDFAKKYVGEVSSEDKKEAKYQAYYESKMEENTKASGGISR